MADKVPIDFADAINAIERPPCEACKYWRPSLTLPQVGMGYGLRLCHALAMQPDFSCFELVAEA